MADNTGAPTMTEIRDRYKQVCEGLVLSDGVLNQSTIYKRDVGMLFALIDRLPKMLPDPVKLRAMAEWLDPCFQDERSKERQAERRRSAGGARADRAGGTGWGRA